MTSRKQFRELIYKHLGITDIQEMCFDLGIDYEDFGEGGKRVKIIALLNHSGASHQQIIDYLRKHRPEVDWPDVTWAKEIPYPETAILKPREREILLNRVQNGWINGVLKQSLHERVKLELGLEYEFNLHGHVAERQNVEFGKEIGEIFDEAGRQLLILGEPGSGKTTTLLMLAEDLLNRAKVDVYEPIPLILNLSTWTAFNSTTATIRAKWLQFNKQETDSVNQKPFERWLVQACFAQYTLNSDITLKMLGNGEIILLLDGLDEVGSKDMEVCLQAINEVGLNEILISSRLKDYNEINTKLRIMTGVQILPLTDEHIEDYFNDKRFSHLKSVVETDINLKELARTPLMLSIMALAFEEASKAELNELQTHPDKVDFIFSKYVDQMFIRRPVENEGWAEEIAKHWLACIAGIMQEHNQTTFSIAGIQPTWIPSKKSLLKYKITLGLASGGIYAILFSFILGILIFALLSFGHLIVNFIGQRIDDELALGLGTAGWLFAEMTNGFRAEFLSAFAIFISVSLWATAYSTEEIRLKNKLIWKFEPLSMIWVNNKILLIIFLALGFFYGFLFGRFANLAAGSYGGEGLGILVGRYTGFSSAGVFWLISIIATWLSICFQSKSIEQSETSDDLVYLSIFNTIIIVLSITLVSSAIVILLIGIFLVIFGATLNSWTLISLIVGFAGGLFGGVVSFFGIRTQNGVFKYFVIRKILTNLTYLPFRWWQHRKVIKFLNSMSQRLLLQKIEGNWRFVHKSLQDHFASKSPISWEKDRFQHNQIGQFFKRIGF